MTTSSPTASRAATAALETISARAGAQASTENFPVALRVVPESVRSELLAAYRYCRFVDDVGDGDRGADEQIADRAAALDAIAADVERLPGTGASLPVVAALGDLVRRRPEVTAALLDLVEANRVDQRVRSYQSFADLLGYCRLSAAPVGRLVLAIAGVDDPAAVRASDEVCAALQVLEHCQDVGEDARRGRVYLPQADLTAAGVPEAALTAARTSPALRGVVALQVRRSRDLLAAGRPLVGMLHGWARIAVAGYVGGGRATAVALERLDYGVLEQLIKPRRRRTAVEAAALLAGAVRR